jgi:hypothetical protein
MRRSGSQETYKQADGGEPVKKLIKNAAVALAMAGAVTAAHAWQYSSYQETDVYPWINGATYTGLGFRIYVNGNTWQALATWVKKSGPTLNNAMVKIWRCPKGHITGCSMQISKGPYQMTTNGNAIEAAGGIPSGYDYYASAYINSGSTLVGWTRGHMLHAY